MRRTGISIAALALLLTACAAPAKGPERTETEGRLLLAEDGGALLVAEEQAARGCVGQRLAARLELDGLPARTALVNCGEGFVPHGAASLLKRDLSLDGAGICKKALEVLGRG